MNTEEFLTALSDISPEFIDEAADPDVVRELVHKNNLKKARRKKAIISVIGLAACALIGITVFFSLDNIKKFASSDSSAPASENIVANGYSDNAAAADEAFNNVEEAMEDIAEDVDDGITFEVLDVDPFFLICLLTNDSGEELFFDNYYVIEHKVDDKWVALVPYFNPEPQYEKNIVPSGGDICLAYQMDVFGPLEPGTYRVKMPYGIAEFEITDEDTDWTGEPITFEEPQYDVKIIVEGEDGFETIVAPDGEYIEETSESTEEDTQEE